jgi:hypothetical protein
LKKVLIIIVIILIAIQFIPVNKTNPPVTAGLNAPAELMSVFKKSCYDCHSHETVWPWYSNIVPVSLLIINDVNEGRGHLNFSEWENLSRKNKAKLKEEIWEEIEKGGMPLGKYILLHPEAELNQKDKDLIKEWSGE